MGQRVLLGYVAFACAAVPGSAAAGLFYSVTNRGCGLECLWIAFAAPVAFVVATGVAAAVGHRLGLGLSWGVITGLAVAAIVVVMLQARPAWPGPEWLMPFWVWPAAMGLVPAGAAVATQPPLRAGRLVVVAVSVAAVAGGLAWVEQTVQHHAAVESMESKLEKSGLTPIRLDDGRDWQYDVSPLHYQSPIWDDEGDAVRYVGYRLSEPDSPGRTVWLEVVSRSDRGRYLKARRQGDQEVRPHHRLEPGRMVDVGDVVVVVVGGDGFSDHELDEIAGAIEPTTAEWLAHQAPDPRPWSYAA